MAFDAVRSGWPEIISKRFSELTAQELLRVLELRSEVFVVEQACVYNDIDGHDDDPNTVHHWLDGPGRIAAYVREIRDGDLVRIGRVVTHREHRGRGLAAELVRSIVAASDVPIRLEAQTQLVPWYSELGFEVDGANYLEDGIPHTPMRLRDRSPPN